MAKRKSSVTHVAPSAYPYPDAEDDFRTLRRAGEVQADAGRHRKALGHGRKELSAIRSVMKPTGARSGINVRGKRGRSGVRLRSGR